MASCIPACGLTLFLHSVAHPQLNSSYEVNKSVEAQRLDAAQQKPELNSALSEATVGSLRNRALWVVCVF